MLLTAKTVSNFSYLKRKSYKIRCGVLQVLDIPPREFNGCKFQIWASLDSLFSWMPDVFQDGQHL